MSSTLQDKRIAERYIPRGYDLVHQDQDVHIYHGDITKRYADGDQRTRPAMLIFKARAKNPLQHYIYADEADRAKRQAEIVAAYSTRRAAKQERAAERKKFEHSVKIGDIFYTSWGYDQTNIDFYQVTGVSGSMVTVHQIAGSITGYDSSMSGDKVAAPGEFLERAEPIRKRVQDGGSGEPFLKISSFEYAYPWDGRPKSWSSWA